MADEVLYRDFRADGSLVLVMPQRVVLEDARGLLTWRPVGTPLLVRRTVDGRDRREIPFRRRHTVQWQLAPVAWAHLHVLQLFRPGRAHSVWWMFNPDFTLSCWYVNLEAPAVRWSAGGLAGVDTFDHALDIVVMPDRTWRWKDEGEYLERIGHPAYWTTAQAKEIRAEGERVAAEWKLVCSRSMGPGWISVRTRRGPRPRCQPRAGIGRELTEASPPLALVACRQHRAYKQNPAPGYRCGVLWLTRSGYALGASALDAGHEAVPGGARRGRRSRR